jgi:hypothetical protein
VSFGWQANQLSLAAEFSASSGYRFFSSISEIGAPFAVDSTVMRGLPRPATSAELTLDVTSG